MTEREPLSRRIADWVLYFIAAPLAIIVVIGVAK